jgi:hypothetical protein
MAATQKGAALKEESQSHMIEGLRKERLNTLLNDLAAVASDHKLNADLKI